MLDRFLRQLRTAASHAAVTHLNIVAQGIASRYMCLVVQLPRHHSVQHPVQAQAQAQALKFRALFPPPVPLPRSKSIFVAYIHLKTRQPSPSLLFEFHSADFLTGLAHQPALKPPVPPQVLSLVSPPAGLPQAVG
jgi:hypothetical protein